MIFAGGAFTWISCPHYLGEIVIYAGLLVMQRGAHLNCWLILAWVVPPPPPPPAALPPQPPLPRPATPAPTRASWRTHLPLSAQVYVLQTVDMTSLLQQTWNMKSSTSYNASQCHCWRGHLTESEP